MKRRLFTIFTALSLLLCTATAILWVRSFYVMDAWNHRGPYGKFWWRDECTIRTMRGKFWYGWQHNGGFASLIMEAYHASDFPGFHSYRLQPPLQTWGMKGPQFLGFESLTLTDIAGYAPQRAVVIPIWPIILITALLPLAWLWQKRRRHPIGTCPSCGYDLRASPDRCPECGTPVVLAKSRAAP